MTSVATSLTTVLDRLSDGDCNPILDWLIDNVLVAGTLDEVDLEIFSRIAQWNFDGNASPRAVVDHDTRGQEQVVRRAFAAAAQVPYAASLLMLYLKYECEEAWKVTWLHAPIRRTIEMAQTAWEMHSSTASQRT